MSTPEVVASELRHPGDGLATRRDILRCRRQPGIEHDARLVNHDLSQAGNHGHNPSGESAGRTPAATPRSLGAPLAVPGLPPADAEGKPAAP
ncbi:MAG TPA: hypothetical protein VGL95_02325 [Acetobacteraceae bacterium]